MRHNIRIYRGSLYQFLGIELAFPSTLERINTSKVRRYPTLGRLIKSLGHWKGRQKISIRFGVLAALRIWNKIARPVDPIEPGMSLMLSEEFESDIRVLSNLMERDLTP